MGLGFLCKLANWHCTPYRSLRKVSLANCQNLLVFGQNGNSSLAKPGAQTLHSETSFRRGCPEECWPPRYSHLSSLVTTTFLYCLVASNSNYTRSWKQFFYFIKEKNWVIKSIFFKCGPKTKRLTFQYLDFKNKIYVTCLFSSFFIKS